MSLMLTMNNPFITEDENYNIFKFDTSLTAEDKTVVLGSRRDDTTPWDYMTDWGDGTIDTNASHTYANDGIYLVKTKYILDEGNDGDNNTRKKLVDCISINKNISNLSDMFSKCINVVEFTNSSNGNINPTLAYGMFYGCSSLTTLDVSNFDISNIASMGDMFNGCKNLTTLDVSNWDTVNVTNMWSMLEVVII